MNKFDYFIICLQLLQTKTLDGTDRANVRDTSASKECILMMNLMMTKRVVGKI